MTFQPVKGDNSEIDRAAAAGAIMGCEDHIPSPSDIVRIKIARSVSRSRATGRVTRHMVWRETEYPGLGGNGREPAGFNQIEQD